MATTNYYPDSPLACPEDINGGTFSAKVSKVKGAVLLRLGVSFLARHSPMSSLQAATDLAS